MSDKKASLAFADCHHSVIHPIYCLAVKSFNSVLIRLGNWHFYATFVVGITLNAVSWAQTAEPLDAALLKPLELQFRDFFKLPIGDKGLEISPALTQANGQLVTLTGYMVQQEVPDKGAFLLTPRPVQMSEHADGDADDLPPATVLVMLAPAQVGWVVPHVRGLLRITGMLSVGRKEDGNGRVSWVQLRLAPEAAQGMSTFELANHMHLLQHRH